MVNGETQGLSIENSIQVHPFFSPADLEPTDLTDHGFGGAGKPEHLQKPFDVCRGYGFLGGSHKTSRHDQRSCVQGSYWNRFTSSLVSVFLEDMGTYLHSSN